MNKRKTALYTLIMTLLISGGYGVSYAAPPAPAASACDPSYYDTLESRAWLEAQREITQNQNLISKPDSVLRYSCFDKSLDDYSSAASGMFSGGVDVSDAKSAATSFVSDNYASVHSQMIGGRASGGSSLDGNCNAMAQVWEDAQCMNFADEPGSDAFFTLAEYVSGSDKRFDASCSKPSGWQDESDALLDDNTAWTEDLVVSEVSLLGASCADSKFIDTGVQSIKAPSNDGNSFSGRYNVKVCVVQGCVYEPTGEDSGSCEEYTP